MSHTFRTQKIKVRTSYREIFKRLEDAILTGELKPTEAIPTEAQLCDMFGTSRTTVREGIRLLEETGLVERNPSRRLVVCKTNISHSTASVIRTATLQQVTLEELWQVECELQVLACQMMIANADESFDLRLQENIKKTEKSLGCMDELVAADNEFHNILFDGARNTALNIARRPLGILVFATGQFVIKGLEQSAERLLVAHSNIAKAIIERDEETAIKWLRKHLRDYRNGCILAGAEFDRPIGEFLDINLALDYDQNTS